MIRTKLKGFSKTKRPFEYKLTEEEVDRLATFVQLLITIDKRFTRRDKQEKDRLRLEAKTGKKNANVATRWRLCADT
jgi:hypothetical protein